MPYPDINSVRQDIIRFFKCYDEISIHQFGYLFIYLPVYQALAKLQGANIEYPEYRVETDVKTVNKLLKNKSGFLNGKLHFGLSEIHKCEKCISHCTFKALPESDYDKLHHYPMISKLPLWGIVRTDNAKLRKKVNENKYFSTFGPKISALDIKDFEGLKVLIYPRGTTVRRLFEKELIKAGIRKSDLQLINYESEADGFKKLYNKKCDVCITIQPWLFAAYLFNTKNPKAELAIIYNKIPPQTRDGYTSLYVRKLDEAVEDRILNKMLHLMALLIWDEIRNIYSVENRSEYIKMVQQYCWLKAKRQKKYGSCVEPEQSGDDCAFCDHPKAVALEVLNDSRIYHTHPNIDSLLATSEDFKTTLQEDIIAWQQKGYLENITATSTLTSSEIVKQYFPYHWANNINWVRDSEEERMLLITNDPIFLMSQFWLGLIGKNHAKTLLDAEDKQKISRFLIRAGVPEKDVAKLLTNVHYDKATKNINTGWRFDETEDFINVISNKLNNLAHNEFPRFYFNRDVLKTAFEYFDIGKKWFKVDKCSSGILTQGKEAIIWLLVEYSVNKQGNGPGKFGNREHNKIGFSILNGYWFKGTKGKHIIKRYGHPSLENNTLDWNGSKTKFTIESPEAWLFTFRTIADVGRLLHDMKGPALGLYGADPAAAKDELLARAAQIIEMAEQQTELKAELISKITTEMNLIIKKLHNADKKSERERTDLGNSLSNICEILRQKVSGEWEEESDGRD